MYMEGFKCKVTNAKSTTPVGTPKPPVWCEDDQSKCVQGPKQIMIWNQLEGTNIEVEGEDLSGSQKSPAYNAKCGFKDGTPCTCCCESSILTSSGLAGAQNDIFTTSKRMVHKHKRNWFTF